MDIANRMRDLDLKQKLADNSHLTRWVTGLVAAPFLVFAIVWGDGALFGGVVAVAAVVALWEYMGLISPGCTPRERVLAGIPAYFMAPLTIYAAGNGHLAIVPAFLMLYLLIFAAVAVRRFKHHSKAWHTVAFQLMAFCHVTVPLCLAVIIRKSPLGITWIFALLLIIFAGDIGAYYTGKTIGKHKLAPAVSPKKTIEGSIGGILANLLIAGLYQFFFMPEVSLEVMLLIAVLTGAAGQIGDLFVSVLKRDGGIKDSGHILPGHGGILDRIDALLLALPVAWILIELLVKRTLS